METADVERMVRKALNEGTGKGQKSWAGTSKATLAGVQHLSNILRLQIIPRLPAPSKPSLAGSPSPDGEASEDQDNTTDPGESGQDDIPQDLPEPDEILIPAAVLMAMEELYLTLTPEQAGALASFFSALSEQEEELSEGDESSEEEKKGEDVDQLP